jgi:hypothetical protein
MLLAVDFSFGRATLKTNVLEGALPMKLRTQQLATVAMFLFVSPAAYAASCEDYPFTQGISVENIDGGIRVIATAAVSVSFDDVDSIKDARDEATLEAKGLISDFLAEGIAKVQVVKKVVDESKSMQGDSKAAVRNETIQRLKVLAGSSAALLRGVVPLGECYTKGKEFRSSVGIKPETISSAEGLAGQLNGSPERQDGPGTPSEGPLNGVDSYSKTKELDKF